MKIYKIDDLKASKNPNSDEKIHRTEVLTTDDGAKNLGCLFAIVEPGAAGRKHYHENREAVFIVVEGEAIVHVEGKDYDLKTGDIIYLNAKEKHYSRNKSSTAQMKFIEFFTEPPVGKDYVAVDE